MAVLKRDSKGRWVVRFYCGGRGSRRFYAALPADLTEKKARKAAEALEAAHGNGTAASPNITFNRAADLWFDLHAKKTSPSSQKVYAAALKTLRARFGNQKVRTLRPIDAELYLQDREAAGMSNATRRRDLSVLTAVLSWSEARGLIDRSPVRRGAVARPRAASRTVVLEPEEWARFDAAASGHSSAPLWRFLVLTASRISEGCGLSWQDVDFAGKVVRIFQKKTGKTKAIPLSPELEDVFRSCVRGVGGAPVFTNASGERWVEDWARDRFEWIRKRAGLPDDVTPHVLRHSSATWAFRAGVGLDRVTLLCGHRDPAMAQRYAHARPVDAAEALRAVARAACGRNVDENDGYPALTSSSHGS